MWRRPHFLEGQVEELGKYGEGEGPYQPDRPFFEWARFSRRTQQSVGYEKMIC